MPPACSASGAGSKSQDAARGRRMPHVAARYDWASKPSRSYPPMPDRFPRGTACAQRPSPGRLLPGRGFLLPVALSLALAGCAAPLPPVSQPPPREPTPAEKGMKPLSGPEVKQILSKARYRWQGAQGATGTAVTSEDGRVRVMWETGAVNGRIRFDETGYCSRFEGVRNGVEDCYRLYRTGPRDFTVVRLDGTPSGTIALLD